MRPVASVDSRSSIIARTTSRSTSGPDPAACERTRLRCSSTRRSGGMCRVASAPNPVEMPYCGSGAVGQRLDHRAARGDALLGLGGQAHRGAAAGHRDDLLPAERPGTDDDGGAGEHVIGDLVVRHRAI